MTQPIDVPPADPNSTPQAPDPDTPTTAPNPGLEPDTTPEDPEPENRRLGPHAVS